MQLISTKERSCPSRASTWISNVICRGLYCCQWFWGERWVCWYWWNCWPSCLKISLHSHISHIIVEYKKDHWLNIFMLCKLQQGKIEGIWYLQLIKVWQVVEYAWLDWFNLIIAQRTTKKKKVLISVNYILNIFNIFAWYLYLYSLIVYFFYILSVAFYSTINSSFNKHCL